MRQGARLFHLDFFFFKLYYLTGVTRGPRGGGGGTRVCTVCANAVGWYVHQSTAA